MITAWRILAGPESVLFYTHDRRSSVDMWTADIAGRMRHGDVALMYGTGRMQSYVAIARACCDPVENDRAQRLRRHRRPWVYLSRPVES